MCACRLPARFGAAGTPTRAQPPRVAGARPGPEHQHPRVPGLPPPGTATAPCSVGVMARTFAQGGDERDIADRVVVEQLECGAGLEWVLGDGLRRAARAGLRRRHGRRLRLGARHRNRGDHPVPAGARRRRRHGAGRAHPRAVVPPSTGWSPTASSPATTTERSMRERSGTSSRLLSCRLRCRPAAAGLVAPWPAGSASSRAPRHRPAPRTGLRLFMRSVSVLAATHARRPSGHHRPSSRRGGRVCPGWSIRPRVRRCLSRPPRRGTL
jgi:hypothetical protein